MKWVGCYNLLWAGPRLASSVSNHPWLLFKINERIYFAKLSFHLHSFLYFQLIVGITPPSFAVSSFFFSFLFKWESLLTVTPSIIAGLPVFLSFNWFFFSVVRGASFLNSSLDHNTGSFKLSSRQFTLSQVASHSSFLFIFIFSFILRLHLIWLMIVVSTSLRDTMKKMPHPDSALVTAVM